MTGGVGGVGCGSELSLAESGADVVVAAVESAEEFDDLGVMVDDAGIVSPVEFLESTEEDYWAMLDVHLEGTTAAYVTSEAILVEGARPTSGGRSHRSEGRSRPRQPS